MAENSQTETLFELRSIVSDLSPGGKSRSVLLTGQPNEVILKKEDVAQKLVERNRDYLWIEVDGQTAKSPEEWLANFARNMRGGNGISEVDMRDFARKIGGTLTPFASSQGEKGSINKSEQDDASILSKVLDLFEDAFGAQDNSHKPITPVLCLLNLSKFSDPMLAWISGSLNQGLRDSEIFSNARFLFTDTTYSERVKNFFDRFGFDKVRQITVPDPVDRPETKNEQAHSTLPQPQTKGLKKNMKSDTLTNNPFGMSNKNRSGIVADDISTYPSKEQKYLSLACLPSRINRYTLEFFCDSTASAYCYNWLLRQPDLAKQTEDGFLVLNEDIRNQARAFLKEKDPTAESKEVLASVLDTFMALFPSPESHWIPINLQMFASFSEDLCKDLFNSVDYEEILDFLNVHADQFINENNFYCLQEETKLVTRRLMELAELSPMDGLREMAEEKWNSDQNVIEERKAKIGSKKLSLEQEIDDIKGQITHFDEMRNQIDGQFQNSKNSKTRKVYTFSMALPLLVLGLGTVGASLFSDSMGTYHAACGLFLTFVGFFWPNVEIQKPDLQTVGGKPKLAAETQQRSLNHRISGLVNRASSLKGSLSELDSELENLELGAQTPYLS